MDTNQLPDDLNPEVVKACAEFIGKITGLVPPPHDAFPPEWHGYLRTFTSRLYAVARDNVVASDKAAAPLTTEQREAIEWAAGRAHVMSLGKPVDGTEFLRWRVLSKLFSDAPVAPAAAPSEDAYVAARLSATLANVYATIIGDDTQPEDEALNAIERVKKAAQVLRLEVDLYRAQREEAAAPIPLLAADHKGMRVDYSGVFKQATTALARGLKEPGLAEMLRQLQEHITELGQRWYAGDTAVVDELLQLYCVEKDARDALVATSGAAQ